MKQGFFKRTTVSTTANNWPLILQALGNLDEEQVDIHADSFKTPCPLCNRRSCYVFKGGEDGNWSCHHCGDGDGWTLLQKVNNWDFTVAVNEINNFVRRGAILPVLTRKPRTPPPPRDSQDSIKSWINRLNQEPQLTDESALPENMVPEPTNTQLNVSTQSKASTQSEANTQPEQPQEHEPEPNWLTPKVSESVVPEPGPGPALADTTEAETEAVTADVSTEPLATTSPQPKPLQQSQKLEPSAISSRENKIIRRFSAHAVGQVVRDIQPSSWLIADFLEQSALVQFSAPPAVGKSFLAVDIAASVATGKDFHGLSTRQGLVFFIPGNSLADMKKRFRAWELHNQTSLEGTPLFLLPPIADIPLPTYFSEAENEMARVANSRNMRPQLIVVDRSANLHCSAEEMELLALRVRGYQKKFGCSVVLTGDNTTVSRSVVDAEYQIVRQEERSTMTIESLKMRDGELAAPLELALIPAPIGLQGESGQQITCAVLTKTDHGAVTEDYPLAGAAGANTDSRSRSRPLTSFQEAVLQAIYVRSAHEGQASYQAVLDDIKAKGVAGSNYARTINALIQRNLITMEGDDLLSVTAAQVDTEMALKEE